MTVLNFTSFSDCKDWQKCRWIAAIEYLQSEGKNPQDYFCGFVNDMMADDRLVRKDNPEAQEIISYYNKNTWADLGTPYDAREISQGKSCEVVDINKEVEKIRDVLTRWEMPVDQTICPFWAVWGISAICKDSEGKKWTVHSSGSRSRKY